jgi:hypothetical protein
LHIEPDFWGYAAQTGADPRTLQAAVRDASSTDCADLDDSIAGMVKCMITMARRYAPNAKVGLHASSWGTNIDVLQNRDPSFDVTREGTKLGNWLSAAGAGDGDFVGSDMCDRDADWYRLVGGKNVWFDATNTTLPNFHQAFAWSGAVASAVGRPIIWWQLPVGNSSLPNTTSAWKDNRVDYLFAHPDEVVSSGAVGMAFGAGQSDQTTPSSDGGNLAAKAASHRQLGGVAVCP